MEMQYSKNSSYLDFMKTKGNRYRLAILISLGIISQYSGNALFSNYMSLIYNSMGITDQNKKIPVCFHFILGYFYWLTFPAKRRANIAQSGCQFIKCIFR